MCFATMCSVPTMCSVHFHNYCIQIWTWPHTSLILHPTSIVLLFIAGNTPLYHGAPITCKKSWTSIYKFAVSNQLSDSSTQQLLNLFASHCPTCPQTVYKLKKQVEPTEVTIVAYACHQCLTMKKSAESALEKILLCSYAIWRTSERNLLW